jgi:predicted aspartyl protease/regulator of sirC expression with transglutaminase-like and TPR domain
MKRWTVALVLLLPALGWAQCKLQTLELPVTMVGKRPITTVRINGIEVKLLVDSGAFFSMLTDATATRLGLQTGHVPFGMEIRGLTGEVEARLTRVKSVQLPQGEIPDVDFLVGGNEVGGGAMGLLGRNFLDATDVEYDLGHGAVRMMFPQGDCGDANLAYWAGSRAVTELRLVREYRQKLAPLKGTASLNGKSMRVEFDTGAMSMVSLSAARRAGIAAEQMTPAGRLSGAGRGDAAAWTAPFESFELGGERIRNSRLMVADIDMKDIDMLIGVDFFLSHRLYASKSQRKLFWTYEGGPVFALNEVASTSTQGDPPADGDAPSDAAGYARRGAALAARGAYARALADLDRACELEPTAASHFTRRGAVQMALQQADKALHDFDQALRLEPLDHEARLQRVHLREAAREREAVFEDLRELDRSLAPQDHMRRDVARAYERLDSYELALPQWNVWIAAHPNEASLHVALNARCWARAMLNTELDPALADCDAAIKRVPDNASYLDSRAWVHLRQGRWREALADYERALSIRPQAVWSLYGRGIARIQSGNREAGLADIAAARQLRPSMDEETKRYGIEVP